MIGFSLLIALLSGVVFWASLKNEQKKVALNGPGPDPSTEIKSLSLKELESLNQLRAQQPSSTPNQNVQDVLRTVDEINRINRQNLEMRQRMDNRPPLPVPPSGRTKEK